MEDRASKRIKTIRTTDSTTVPCGVLGVGMADSDLGNDQRLANNTGILTGGGEKHSNMIADDLVTTDSHEIDDSLYSRQRYVLGDGAMQRLARSNVLVCGAGGTGVEIAKNIVLAGVKSLTIQDTRPTTMFDLGTQFFLDQEDIGKNRAEACAHKLQDLNPYVTVESSTAEDVTSAPFLAKFQCVVATECSLEEQLAIDHACRTANPPICYLSADVRGLFGMVFVDFGNSFEVVDATGEDAREVLVADISSAEEAVVTCIENRMHGLEDGDSVFFREVQGMDGINSSASSPVLHKVKVITPYKFAIGDTTSFGTYVTGGIATQVVRKQTMSFQSLEQQLKEPTLLLTDYAKMDNSSLVFWGLLGVHDFVRAHGRYPAPRSDEDAAEVIQLAHKRRHGDVSADGAGPDSDVIRMLAWTSQGVFAPMCAVLGGWAAQEALKGLTGKFTPLNQVLCIDMMEVAPVTPPDAEAFRSSFAHKGDRYDALRTCIGDDLCQKIADTKLFMVGCGAIGCEMLKNYALLGVSASDSGSIVITDNDIIEKSNLNRQFLFRPEHIRESKSAVAARTVLAINPSMHIEAHQHKVEPATTATVYTDDFFRGRDVIVNALDNVQARLFMDSRCVTAQRPLLESGTMGAKGHVQVIVPHLTESYASQRDPPENDIPYCTLKSFPSTINHTIQWARDKFANLFELKPAEHNKFWTTNGSLSTVLQALKDGDCGKSYDNTSLIIKMNRIRPTTFAQCVGLARHKFEKYFNHKARHLLNAFAPDLTMPDGSLFWASPKRQPTPLEFDAENAMHLDFIASAARLFAECYGVVVEPRALDKANLIALLQDVPVPSFVPKASKAVETDESVTKEQIKKKAQSLHADFPTLGTYLAQAVGASDTGAAADTGAEHLMLHPAIFEKDDDANGHIHFIASTSNLRAAMYGIAPVDKLKTKLVAGKIVPAIATTTAAVSGLVAAELVKIVSGSAKLADYKNAFLNLALPFMIFTEPAEPVRDPIANGQMYSIWDQWSIQGARDMTLAQFIAAVESKYNLTPIGIVSGLQMVYMQPIHASRLPKLMRKLLKPARDVKYMDLVVTMKPDDPTDPDQAGGVSGPPIRYFF
eukprot:m.1334633 g.1334633  ORF g.1334633 m.1334633 type:complete len:1101 (-) comp24875_c1_seq8:1780-5082(-)